MLLGIPKHNNGDIDRAAIVAVFADELARLIDSEEFIYDFELGVSGSADDLLRVHKKVNTFASKPGEKPDNQEAD